jgi:hypothetical protein
VTAALRDTGGVSTETVKRKRGFETALDMVRSLALVLIPVLIVWFFARPPSVTESEIRTVDPSPELAYLSEQVPRAPVPVALSDEWRPTSSTLDQAPLRLRVGYVTPGDRYAEYAASTGPVADYVEQLTGSAPYVGEVRAGGQTWRQHRDSDGSLSLVRTEDGLTVVLGSTRASATLDELRELAESLAAG